MEFYWERWETTDHHVTNCPDRALSEAINSGLNKRHAKELFLKLWAYWWSKSPEACVLVTLTDNYFNQGNQQLRFWFKDRDDAHFGFGQHVDSSGHDLIVSIHGPINQLHGLVKTMLPTEEFKEELIPVPADAHKHHTSPSPVLIWRRKAKQA